MDNKKKFQPEKNEKGIVVSYNNNVNSSPANEQCTFSRRCPPVELIKNGGFEQKGIFSPFAEWDEITSNFVIRSFSRPYEGILSAEFISNGTPNAERKSARLFQEVTVPPGCYLVLGFADNFRRAGDDFDGLNIRASVFYEDTARVNLINVEIRYDPEADQAGQGFVFHQRVSDNPVPDNVSSVTVEFFVETVDSQSGTQWLLDGVSLRPL